MCPQTVRLCIYKCLNVSMQSFINAIVHKELAMAKKTPEPGAEAVKTVTLRLPPLVHDQLREMAFTSRRSQHALCMEALNLLFRQHKKPAIAPVAQ